MYYRISKCEKILFFGKKNRPGVGSDLNLNVRNERKIVIKLRVCTYKITHIVAANIPNYNT